LAVHDGPEYATDEISRRGVHLVTETGQTAQSRNCPRGRISDQ
jgi:hypothetical protein